MALDHDSEGSSPSPSANKIRWIKGATKMRKIFRTMISAIIVSVFILPAATFGQNAADPGPMPQSPIRMFDQSVNINWDRLETNPGYRPTSLGLTYSDSYIKNWPFTQEVNTRFNPVMTDIINGPYYLDYAYKPQNPFQTYKQGLYYFKVDPILNGTWGTSVGQFYGR